MYKFLLILLFYLLVMMPIWIRVVHFKVNNPKTKKVLITMMVFCFFCFIAYSLIQSTTFYSLFDTWIKNIVDFLLIIVTLLSAYHSWPRSGYKSSIQKKYFNNMQSASRQNFTGEIVTVPVMSGNKGKIEVIFSNATFIKKSNSSMKYPDQDFGAWLIEEIYEKRKLFAMNIGLLSRKKLCPSCKTELIPYEHKTNEVTLSSRYKDLPPFTIKVVLPSIQCAYCGNICGVETDGSSPYFLNEAIINMFESNNIRRQ